MVKINLGQIATGAMQQWLKDDDARINAAAKKRAIEDEQTWQKKKMEIQHRYKMKQIDAQEKLKKQKESTTDVVDPNFAHANMPVDTHKHLEALGVPFWARNKEQARSFGTGKLAAQSKAAHYELIAQHISQDIMKNPDRRGYHSNVVNQLLSAASANFSGGDMLGSKVTERGDIVQRMLTQDSYKGLSALATLYQKDSSTVSASRQYFSLFEHGSQIPIEGLSEPLRKIVARTKPFSHSSRIKRLSPTLSSSIKVEYQDVDVEGQPIGKEPSVFLKEPQEIKYNVTLGSVPPEIARTALQGITNLDHNNLDGHHLAYAGVNYGGKAFEALQDNIVKDVADNKLANEEIRDDRNTVNTLNWASNLVLLGKRNFQGSIISQDGRHFTLNTDTAPTDRVKYAIEAHTASRDLIEGLDKAIELNKSLDEIMNERGIPVGKITQIESILSSLTAIVGVFGDSSDKAFDKSFSEERIDREFADLGTKSNEQLRNFVKASVAKVKTQRATAARKSEDENYLRISREYSFIKTRLIFMVAKQLQGRGGRVSDADFKNVAASFGESMFGTVPTERYAFEGLRAMTEKQYVYNYYAQMPRITSLTTLEDLTNRAVKLKQAISENAKGAIQDREISGAPSTKATEKDTTWQN
jgi:hypothetical protein